MSEEAAQSECGVDWNSIEAAQHQARMAQRQLASGYAGSSINNFVHLPDPEEIARMEARHAAEEARYAAQRAEERDERMRTMALQLATGLCAQRGDPAEVLGTAQDFLNFLTATASKSH